MSLDGKAQVILDNRSSPSPPRSDRTGPSAKSERPYGLRRSQTDVLPGKQSALAFEDSLPQWPRQAVPGRSRDARTWEFYCDSDARNALTVQAEREQKGSAEGAIGLIRSSSNKGMKSKSVNQNLQRNAAKPTSKRKLCSGNNGPKPKLARTTSSVARLQTVDHKANMLAKQIEPENIKSSSQPAVYREPSGDSDKENWEPGAQVSNVRTRRGPSNFPGTQRAILKDSRIPSLSTSLGAFLESDLGAKQLLLKSQNVEAAAKNDAVVDEEVRAFMQEKNTDREKEDLDCVQNLLSLSQGIWK
ncbi:MAG: hypothetical protein MMC33_006281 [Icmadophila ericetorum]|nr:hypothetical protein [Icmadophila ericetorum]